MNSNDLLTLYKYNAFANNLLSETIDDLPGDVLGAASPSHDSVGSLLRHMLSVETAYLQTCRGEPFDRSSIPNDVAHIISALQALAPQQQAYLENVSAEELESTRTWFGITLPIDQLLTQCVMHSLQHRTEISLLFSQQGYQMPDFDIIKFFILESGQEWPW